MEHLANIGSHWRLDVASEGGVDMTISELAREALEHFTNENERRVWALKDDAPEWVEYVVREAHGGDWPNDWVYEAIVDILGALGDGEFDTVLNARESTIDVCGALTNVGTGALLEWAHDKLSRLHYVDDAMREHDVNSMAEALALGQEAWLMEIMDSVLLSLEIELEDREGE